MLDMENSPPVEMEGSSTSDDSQDSIESGLCEGDGFATDEFQMLQNILAKDFVSKSE